jgi:hypothetical protein
LLESDGLGLYDLHDLEQTLAFGPLAVATSGRCAGSAAGGDLARAVAACLDALGPGAVRRACLRWSNGPLRSLHDRLAIEQHACDRLAALPDTACGIFVTLGLDPDIRSECPGLLHGLLWPQAPALPGLDEQAV